MASLALATANRINVVYSIEQHTLPAAAAITAGAAVTIDSDGKFALADADGAGTLSIAYGIATETVPAGMPVTAIRRGALSGWTLTGIAYWTNVLLADTAGEVTVTSSESNGGSADVVLGRIIPVWNNLVGGTPDKIVMLTL